MTVDEESDAVFTIPEQPAQTFTLKSLLEETDDEADIIEGAVEDADDESESRFLFNKGTKKVSSVIRRRPQKKIRIVQRPQQILGRETVIYLLKPTKYQAIRIVTPAVMQQQQQGPDIVIEESQEEIVDPVKVEPVAAVDKKKLIASRVEMISSVLTGLTGLAAQSSNNAPPTINVAAVGTAPEIVEPIINNKN